MLSPQMKGAIVRALSLKNKEGELIDALKRIPIPMVVTLPSGEFFIGLTASYRGGDLNLRQIHDLYETSLGDYCKPAETSERSFSKSEGWVGETLSEFFGVNLPRFISSDVDPDELAAIDAAEAQKRKAAADLALIKKDQPVKPPKEKEFTVRDNSRFVTAIGLEEAAECWKREGSGGSFYQKAKKDARIAQSRREVVFAYIEEYAKAPSVRVLADLIRSTESEAGKVRDDLCTEWNRLHPIRAITWEKSHAKQALNSAAHESMLKYGLGF